MINEQKKVRRSGVKPRSISQSASCTPFHRRCLLLVKIFVPTAGHMQLTRSAHSNNSDCDRKETDSSYLSLLSVQGCAPGQHRDKAERVCLLRTVAARRQRIKCESEWRSHGLDHTHGPVLALHCLLMNNRPLCILYCSWIYR